MKSTFRFGDALARSVVCVLLVAPTAVSVVAAQQPVRRVFGGAPAASWIAPAGVAPDAYGVYHFRRTLDRDVTEDEIQRVLDR